MKYRWEAQCKIHGLEIGYAVTPEECEANAHSQGCEIEWWSLFAPENEK